MTQPRILIVEDEAIIAADLQRRLSRMGCEVLGMAASGADAVRLATALKPELVLMDINLRGEMDGTQTARQLRNQLQLPVIYLTASSDAMVVERAKLTDAFGYLLKPLDERLLYITIEMALYKHQMELERKKLIGELQEALARVKLLSGLLPICASCKNIRDEQGYWHRVEAYIRDHSEADFSHGFCPQCARKWYPGYFDEPESAQP
ncbi:MAG: response regulator [Acidobacteria bacterium]|nr:response regulator [Acidobacteriota bacterium]